MRIATVISVAVSLFLLGCFVLLRNNQGVAHNQADTRTPPTTPYASQELPVPAVEATAEALRIYPDLGKKDSVFNTSFVALYNNARKNSPNILQQPDWPLVIAQRTASYLHIQPSAPIGPKFAASHPVSPAPSPASTKVEVSAQKPPPTEPALVSSPTPPASEPNESPKEPEEPSKFSSFSDCLVIVEGDHSVGSGFLIHRGNGTAVATNAHVLSGNNRISLRTLNGESLKPGSLSVAKSIDLALIEVKHDGRVLEVASSVSDSAQMEDKVVVLGNSEGAGVATELKGAIKGIGPDQIEVDAKFVEGNSGSPVIHLKTGKVIGIATYAFIPASEKFEKASPLVKDSEFWKIRRFAYRLDANSDFDRTDLQTFSKEAALLEYFMDNSSAIFRLAQDVAFDDQIDVDWHDRRYNHLALAVRDYTQALAIKRQATHNSTDPRQQFLARLAIECTADIDLYKSQIKNSYHVKELSKIRAFRSNLREQISRLMTQ